MTEALVENSGFEANQQVDKNLRQGLKFLKVRIIFDNSQSQVTKHLPRPLRSKTANIQTRIFIKLKIQRMKIFPLKRNVMRLRERSPHRKIPRQTMQ